MAFYWEGCHGVSCCCPMQFMDHLKKMSFYGKNRGAGSWKKPAGIPGIPSINIYDHRNIPVVKGVNLQTPLLINQPMGKDIYVPNFSLAPNFPQPQAGLENPPKFWTIFRNIDLGICGRRLFSSVFRYWNPHFLVNQNPHVRTFKKTNV